MTTILLAVDCVTCGGEHLAPRDGEWLLGAMLLGAMILGALLGLVWAWAENREGLRRV